MKSPITRLLVLFCLLAWSLAARADGNLTRFDGSYSSTPGRGAVSRVEVNIDSGYVHGTAFLRGVEFFDFLYFNSSYVDLAGNFSGHFRSENLSHADSFFGLEGGTFSGRASGGAMILTLRAREGVVTLVLLRSKGLSPPVIAGRVVYFNGGRVYFYFDEKKVIVLAGDQMYLPYTYLKTGLNTGTVSIPGFGTFRLTFTDRWEGNIAGPDVDTIFESYDYSD